WLPDHLLLVPLRQVNGSVRGLALYAREQPWSEEDVAGVQSLHLTYAHCYAALSHQGKKSWSGLGQIFKRRNRWIALAALTLSMFIPVRLSVLAPAEVIALSAVAVTAPQEGVIGSFAVAPNARVKAGDLLFSLDDS